MRRLVVKCALFACSISACIFFLMIFFWPLAFYLRAGLARRPRRLPFAVMTWALLAVFLLLMLYFFLRYVSRETDVLLPVGLTLCFVLLMDIFVIPLAFRAVPGGMDIIRAISLMLGGAFAFAVLSLWIMPFFLVFRGAIGGRQGNRMDFVLSIAGMCVGLAASFAIPVMLFVSLF